MPAVIAAAALAAPSPGRGESLPKQAPQPALRQSSETASQAAATAASVPTRWLPSKGRECTYRGRYKGFCQGPRRVPEPHGPAAALAQELGLGEHKTVSHLMLGAPKPEWVAAAGEAGPEPAGGEELSWPVVGGKLWRGFGRVKRGKRRKGRHKGVDIGAEEGTLIRAAKSGLVVYSNNEVRGFGNLLVMVHPDASVTFYAHCKAIYVFPGQRIERGTIVGEVGHTGIARGSHLHFEYRERGYLRDPERRFVDVPEGALPAHRSKRR